VAAGADPVDALVPASRRLAVTCRARPLRRADIEQDVLRETAEEIGATPVPVDVSDAASVRALAREAAGRFGTVHVVCNNAGVGPMAPIAELTMTDWHWIIGVNLYGVIRGVQTFLPILAANPATAPRRRRVIAAAFRRAAEDG